MLPVDEDVFQQVSWNSANPNNTDRQNRNVYFEYLKRIGKIFKITNTQSEKKKSSGSCSTKPAWEKSIGQPEQGNTLLKLIQRTEEVEIFSIMQSDCLKYPGLSLY